MIKKNAKIKLIAGMMSIVTATSPILTYAAEMPMADTVSIGQESGITRIETDANKETRFLFIKLNQGGSVILNKGELDQHRVTLEKLDEEIYINVYDKDGILVSSEDAIKNKRTYIYEVNADSVITVDVDADNGYEIATFESKKNNISEETGFTDDALMNNYEQKDKFSYPVFMKEDTNISVRFKKEKEEKDKDVIGLEPTESKAEKEDRKDVENASDKKDSFTDEASSKNDSKSNFGDKEEDIILNDKDITAQDEEIPDQIPEENTESDLLNEDISDESQHDIDVVDESEDVTSNDQDTAVQDEETLDHMSEEDMDSELLNGDISNGNPLPVEMPELITGNPTEIVENEYFINTDSSKIAEIGDLDVSCFSSSRIVMTTDCPEIIIDKENIIANYSNIYLMQYKTPDQAINAYMYYKDYAEAIEPDMSLEIASLKESSAESSIDASDNTNLDINGTLFDTTSEVNPLNKIIANHSLFNENKEPIIALLDTGASESNNVINRISIIDDSLSGNGHADEMVNAITSQNPNAKIMSIRVMDNDGRGSVASIISGIEYAINNGANIINLSLYARTTLSNTMIAHEIQKAIDNNIQVVCAAGNDGADVKNYMPGSINNAWVLGACDEEGMRFDNSNFGDTVDYNVVAYTTSEAAAKFSGYISLYGTDNIELGNTFYLPEYIPTENIPPEEILGDNLNDIFNTAATNSPLSSVNLTMNTTNKYYPPGVLCTDPDNDNFTRSFTVTYKHDGETISKRSFCIQGHLGWPKDGNYSGSSLEPLDSTTSDKTLAKALFYLYGGPAWGKTIEVSDGTETVNLKQILTDAGCSSNPEYFAMSHYIMCYIYNGENGKWNYNGQYSPVLNSKGVAVVKKIYGYLRRMTFPIAEFTDSTLQGDSKFKTPTIRYRSLDENYASITLPEGITLVDTTTKKTYTGPTTARVEGGDSFYLKGDSKIVAEKSYKLKVKVRFSSDYKAYAIHTTERNPGGGAQDVGFSYSGTTTMELSVKWPKAQEANRWSVQVNAKKVNKALKGLEGAVFEVYDNKECIGERLGKLTSGPDGITNTVQIKDIPGSTKEYTVYLKEVNAPQGYLPITEIFELTFTLDKYNELKAASQDPDNFLGELKTFGPPEGIVNEEGVVTPTPTPSKPSPTPTPGGGTGSGSAGAYVVKTSTAADDIMDLDSYELGGAEFSLTPDRADGTSGTFITNKDGISNSIALADNHKEKYHKPIYNEKGELIQAGWTEIIKVTTVYTVKETKAPKGHKMNYKPYTFSVTMPDDAGKTIKIPFEDEPYFCKNQLAIEKLGVKGNKLAGVVFKVEFFDSTGPDASKLKRTWYLESDENGMIYMDEAHISKRLGFKSEEFFRHDGKIVIPIDGYLQFTEVAAPAEYVVNDKPFGMATGENANLSKRVYNDMELCEVKLKKYEDDGITPIAGVEFEIKFLEATIKPTADKNEYFGRLLEEGESYISSTDENGELVFKGLDHGKYQITEVRTHSGNTLLKEPIIVTVPMTMTQEEANDYGNVDFDTAKEDKSYTDKWFFYSCLFEITNHAKFVVPMTGGNGIWKIGFVGMGVLAMVVTGLIVNESSKKKRKTKKKNK